MNVVYNNRRMKLSPREQTILHHIQLDASISIPALARACRSKEHAIHYTLTRLLTRGFLKKTVFVNPSAIGLTEYLIFLSTATESLRDRQQLQKAITESERVSYMAEVGGEYEYEIVLVAFHPGEVNDFLADLSTRIKFSVTAKQVNTLLSFTNYGAKYFSRDSKPWKVLHRATHHTSAELDEIDHKILSALSSGQGRSKDDLASALHVPASTVSYRIKRMEQRGVILGHFYIMESAQFEMRPFSFLINTSAQGKKFEEQFGKFMLQHPNIEICMQCVGDHDYHLKAFFDDYAGPAELSHELWEKFPKEITKIRILPRFRLLKTSDYPFKNYPFPQRGSDV